MAGIIFADRTGHYDGRDLEIRPLGGTETSVIRCARELARRGHAVSVYTDCDAPVEHEGVSWLPLGSAPPESCDAYVAAQQPELIGFVRRPKRRAIWVLWPLSQLKHYKKIWRMWLYRPIPILISRYQADTYSPFLPRRDPDIVIPHGLPDDVRGRAVRPTPPARRAIFASNPQRNLRRLVEIWAASILPRVPEAILDVYGVNALQAGENPWKSWEGSVLPPGMPDHVQRSVRVHPPVGRQELIDAMRDSRVHALSGTQIRSFLSLSCRGAGLGRAGCHRASGGIA